MLKINWISRKICKQIFIFLAAAPLSMSITFAADLPQFDSAEHQAIGDTVNLYDIHGNAILGANYPLTMPNGLKMTYGTIISLAGDYFGVPEEPISLGKDFSEQKQRFLDAYATLAVTPEAVTPATKLMDIIAAEKKALDDGVKAGKAPHDIYNEIDSHEEVEFILFDREKTLKDLYLPLELHNFDHFAPQNEWAFTVGYKVAQETALQAYGYLQQGNETKAQELLNTAYAELGFASHFITDRYATGHMRVPRVELQNAFGIVGGLLASHQHGEESGLGLNVTNVNGETWHAYGDAWYFEDVNKTHRTRIHDYMQSMVESIYDTATGRPSVFNINDLKSVLVTPTADNYYPMFKVVNGDILRRKDLTDPTKGEYLQPNQWNALYTLISLMWPKKGFVPVEIQNELTGKQCHDQHAQLPKEVYPGVSYEQAMVILKKYE